MRLHPEASQASWAFRFLRTLPGIAVILSGMSKLEQVKDNIQTFSEPAGLTEQELGAVEEVSASCMKCTRSPAPAAGTAALTEQELDIPFLLAAYNEYRTGGEKTCPPGGWPGSPRCQKKSSRQPVSAAASVRLTVPRGWTFPLI